MSIPPPPARCAKGHSRLGFLWEEGSRWRCRQCSQERYYKRRATKLEVSREQNRAKQARWTTRNREKRAAYYAVYRAVKKGLLLRPEACERCHKIGAVQASHDDYARQLDVEWLCSACHRLKDAKCPAAVPS